MAQMGLSADVQLDYASSGLQWRSHAPGENALDVIKGTDSQEIDMPERVLVVEDEPLIAFMWRII